MLNPQIQQKLQFKPTINSSLTFKKLQTKNDKGSSKNAFKKINNQTDLNIYSKLHAISKESNQPNILQSFKSSEQKKHHNKELQQSLQIQSPTNQEHFQSAYQQKNSDPKRHSQNSKLGALLKVQFNNNYLSKGAPLQQANTTKNSNQFNNHRINYISQDIYQSYATNAANNGSSSNNNNPSLNMNISTTLNNFGNPTGYNSNYIKRTPSQSINTPLNDPQFVLYSTKSTMNVQSSKQ